MGESHGINSILKKKYMYIHTFKYERITWDKEWAKHIAENKKYVGIMHGKNPRESHWKSSWEEKNRTQKIWDKYIYYKKHTGNTHGINRTDMKTYTATHVNTRDTKR